MRKLFEMTGMKIIRNDSIVKRSANAKIAKSTLDNEIQNEIMTSMNNLKEKNTLMSSLQQKVSKTVIRNWNSLINTLPSNIFNFCRKTLIFSLNNNSNLARWKIIDSPNCDLCGKPQTQIHLLNNCTSAISDGQFKTRFSRRFCSILAAQTSMMCLLMLKDIDVLLNYSTHQFQTLLLLKIIPYIL